MEQMHLVDLGFIQFLIPYIIFLPLSSCALLCDVLSSKTPVKHTDIFGSNTLIFCKKRKNGGTVGLGDGPKIYGYWNLRLFGMSF